VTDQDDLNSRASAGAFIGTLQAGYTDFHYLRDIWKDTTEMDALLGVSMTGIASGTLANLDLKEAAQHAINTNKRIAKVIGINPAARVTAVKPAGTTSLVVGSSSGIHAWHADYYIRRMRVGKNEPLYHYMKEHLPDLVEDDYFKPHLEAVMSFPQKAPEGATLRTESYKDLLERVKKFNTEWVASGHNDGVNNHNVSCTISLKDNEWWDCAEWMWENRKNYNGISVLPFSDHTYKQAPFENCTKEKFEEMYKLLNSIDLSQVKELDDNTEAKDQAACSGGACEVQ
jgi:ribonucleoside-diphosphate reductase alpha chain